MKENEQKNLDGFGLGLSLIIPFLLMWRMLHRFYGIESKGLVVLSIVILLALILKAAALKPWHNLWILLAHGLLVFFKIQTGYTYYSMGMIGLASVILFITIIRVDYLIPLYNVWMPIVQFIGMCVSSLIMGIIFYLIFTPIGILLRILRKDLLDQKLEPQRASYWNKKVQKEFDKKSYTQQF